MKFVRLAQNIKRPNWERSEIKKNFKTVWSDIILKSSKMTHLFGSKMILFTNVICIESKKCPKPPIRCVNYSST